MHDGSWGCTESARGGGWLDEVAKAGCASADRDDETAAHAAKCGQRLGSLSWVGGERGGREQWRLSEAGMLGRCKWRQL